MYNPVIQPEPEETGLTLTNGHTGVDHAEFARQRVIAESIIQLARKKGERVIKQAHEDAQRIRQQAHGEGFQQGYEEGVERGVTRGEEDYRTQVAEILERLKKGEEEYDQYLNQLMLSLEPRIFELIQSIARQVIKKEIERDDEMVLRTIREAAKNLSRRDKILITAHRGEVELIVDHRPNLIQASDMITDLEVVPGDHVQKGGIILSSSEGIIDSRIESQLEVISDIFNS